MAEVDLTTQVAGLRLRHPFWIASAHYTQQESAIESWKEFSPAAVTLKTSMRTPPVETTKRLREKLFPLLPRFGRSLYCDGPKHEEFSSYAETATLLNKALAILPQTIVGISVLAGPSEDYSELRQLCTSAHFCELNLKYSFRVAGADVSYLESGKGTFQEIVEEVRKFCKSFSGLPVFLKLPRELAWLPGTREARDLIAELSRHGQAGLVVANTLKMNIPTFLAEGVEKDLKNGVVCGERLFDHTISLIEGLRPMCDAANIPIVATGGMVTPEETLLAFRAGACAVQLCTAFDYFGLAYYQTLCWNLQSRIEARGLRAFPPFLERLRSEGVASIYAMPFMYFQKFWDDEPQKRMQLDVRRSKRMDVFVMSGRTLVERWEPALRQRFQTNRGLRLLLPRIDGEVYGAIQRSWGISDLELEARRERVKAAKAEFQRIWNETATGREMAQEKAVMTILETEKSPFYSFYIFDDKVYVSPYPFTRPGELGTPLYVFFVGSPEYDRIDKEAATLISFTRQGQEQPPKS